jgi:hypothetical protein
MKATPGRQNATRHGLAIRKPDLHQSSHHERLNHIDYQPLLCVDEGSPLPLSLIMPGQEHQAIALPMLLKPKVNFA